MAAFPKLITDINDEQYVIYKKLGAGGYGTVYAVAACKSGARIGLKLAFDPDNPPADREEAEEKIQDLKTENLNLIMLKKECADYFLCSYGILREKGDTTGDRTYLKMDFVPGMSLEAYISMFPLKSDNKNVGRELRNDFAVQVVNALDKMHKLGVAHQDIKEPNVMWDFQKDKARFIDFGTGYRKQGKEQLKRNDPKFICYSGTQHTCPPEFIYPSYDKSKTMSWTDIDYNYPVKINLEQKDASSLWKGYTGPLAAESANWKLAVAHDIWSIGIMLLHWYKYNRVDQFKAYSHELKDQSKVNAELAGLDAINPFAHKLLSYLLAVNPQTRLANWEEVVKLVSTAPFVDWKTAEYKDFATNYVEKIMKDTDFETAKKKCPAPPTILPVAQKKKKRLSTVTASTAASRAKRASTAASSTQTPVRVTKKSRVSVAPMNPGGAKLVKLIADDIYETFTLEDILAVSKMYGFNVEDSLENLVKKIAKKHSEMID